MGRVQALHVVADTRVRLLPAMQFDRHLPVLTVAETLEFAHACAGKRPDFISKQELKEV
jgi:hypothetical protein